MGSTKLRADATGPCGIGISAFVRPTFLRKIGYAVQELPSGRESFSPDASYYNGALPVNRMRFIEGPPTFAAEVRSENDYGAAAEAEIAAKRDDCFAAGTLAVWDVDPVAETVALYRGSNPQAPLVFGRGDTAHAEPAVPGWSVGVDWLVWLGRSRVGE